MFGKRKPGPATVNRELRCLARMLSLAVEWGELDQNPLARRLRLLTEPDAREAALEPDEVRRLLKACGDGIRPIVTLLVATGMRYTEAAGLRWAEVDLDRRVIRLPAERSKNGEPRKVQLNDVALGVLCEAQARRQARARETEAAGRKLEGAGLVFPHHGKVRPTILPQFRAACETAKLPRLRVHDLRHVAGSAMASAGASQPAIAAMLGHKTLAMAARYTHALSSDVVAASAGLGAYLTGKPCRAGGLRVLEGGRAGEARPEGAADAPADQEGGPGAGAVPGASGDAREADHAQGRTPAKSAAE
ncbi:MAG TPA: site-specific integrase [Myxococcota bacterium]|nr:site-specific integrase [Myxococcota bacterium]HRY95330.1 site-specific integrase [Myxococcota bacterium]HSA20784.1 site-specific integrase [Myxococcota bacterium]